MEYPSYKALCANPTVTAEFLERAIATMDQHPPRDRRRKLVESVTVAGKPLSEAMFLATLEMSTGDWDDEDEPALRRFTAAAGMTKATNPDFDVPGFVFNWCSLPGADAKFAPRKSALEQGNVTTGLIAPPTMRGSLLSGQRESVAVTAEPEPARRMRMR